MKNRSLLKVLFVVLAAGLLTSCMGLDETDPSSLSAPQVKTFEVKDNGSLVFELSASVDKSASSRVAECGFYYSKDKSMSDAERLECRMTGGTFSADLTLRDYGETFYVCAYISDGTAAGEILCASKELRIKDIEDYVEFGAMETMAGQTEDGLSLRCPCEVKEGVGITKWGVCYGQSKNLDIDDSHVEDKGTADNAIDCIIEGLDKNETYYIRPYVCDGEYVAYGAVTELFVNHYTLEDALELPDETSVQLAGIVVGVTRRGFLLSDEDANMLYVFAGNGWETSTVNVGDHVEVDGTMTTYYNDRELTFGNLSVIGKKSVPELDVLALTKDNVKDFIDADHSPCKISVEGQIVKDGVYYNILLGDECVVSPVFPVVDMEQYVGEDVKMTGYYLWTSTNSVGKNVVSFVLTEVVVNDYWYILGRFNDWTLEDPNSRMTLDDNGIWYVLTDFAADGGNLRFHKHDWTVTRGGEFTAVNEAVAISHEDCDIVVPEGRYDVYMSAAADRAFFMTPGITPELNMSDITDLASSGSANCYVVSQSGLYRFPAVQGNGSKSVGEVKSVEVLWESFGTSTAPNVGDLIKSVFFRDDYINFLTGDVFQEGNALIAAKDASGNILWSWHIWLTDQPGKCVYANNAGTMMDRNLGATSATPGDVGALGLLYQWGRKDPFLGSSSISDCVEAISTIQWPSSVSNSSSTGTISYAIQHPTTFISQDENGDWCRSGNSAADMTRWDKMKTIYDPCPSGWRVPDGNEYGTVWADAATSNDAFTETFYDNEYGMSLHFCSEHNAGDWYPTSGGLFFNGTFMNVGKYGYYWSSAPSDDNMAHLLFVSNTGKVEPVDLRNRAYAFSVRCLQE